MPNNDHEDDMIVKYIRTCISGKAIQLGKMCLCIYIYIRVYTYLCIYVYKYIGSVDEKRNPLKDGL